MRPMNDLHVLVLGLGDSGLAMLRWCVGQGARATVWDSREAPPQAAVLAAELPQVQSLSGELDLAVLADVRWVLKSPGLSPRDPRIAPVLDAAQAGGVPVWGELTLFMRALAALKADRGYAPAVIAITGTNGKTTTTAMTAQLVERTGRSVAVAGNIGPTMLDTLAARLAAVDAHAKAAMPAGGDTDSDAAADPSPEPNAPELPAVWVLELSSFQLDGVEGFTPDAATVLNLTEDHLDWHGSMAAYAAAKARILGPAEGTTAWVLNRDDPRVEALVPPPPAPVKGRAVKTVARRVLRFGLGAPQHPGDFGLVHENGIAWLVRALESDEPERRPRKGAAAEPEELHLQRLMPADALRVRGRHNAANALAALALATAIGCPLAPMLHGLRDYAGEPHRLQFVAGIGGVDAYDDSKGTNVGATVAAIDGLGSDRAPARLAVILGGDGKGQDFAPLAAPLRQHARAVATIGRDAPAIEAALAEALAAAEVPLQRHASLEAATAWCFGACRPGDAVLLSPACASLDMFRNYAHRAEVFVAEVLRLAAEAGEMAA